MVFVVTGTSSNIPRGLGPPAPSAHCGESLLSQRGRGLLHPTPMSQPPYTKLAPALPCSTPLFPVASGTVDLRVRECELKRPSQPRLLTETTKEQVSQEDRHEIFRVLLFIFLLQFSLFYVSSTFPSRFF